MKRISNNFPELKDFYYVTEDGKIFSEKSNIFLKPAIDKYGYEVVRPMGKDGTPKNRFVHRLVLGTFNPIEEINNKTVNHIDTNKRNNKIENLEWMTIQENNAHAVEHGLRGKTGEKNPNSKLTIIEVEEILNSLGKISQQKLADKYGVSKSTIVNIKNKRTWKKEIEEILQRKERPTTKS